MYNRIAGPYNPFTPTATGLNTPAFDGVMLARINVDISLADFEGGVRNLMFDVENAYWELYFSYRALEASKAGRDSALQTWQKIHALYMVGARGGEAEKEAQSRAQYFLFRGTGADVAQRPVPSRKPAALRDRPGHGRRTADSPCRRADDGRSVVRLARQFTPRPLPAAPICGGRSGGSKSASWKSSPPRTT